MAGKKVGRPEAITPEVEEIILQRLAYQSVHEVFKDESLPTRQTFYNHCRAHADFFDASARMRAYRSLVELDEAEKKLEEANREDIAVTREQMHHARWKVSRMLKQYYSDRAIDADGAEMYKIRVERVDKGDDDV